MLQLMSPDAEAEAGGRQPWRVPQRWEGGPQKGSGVPGTETL